MRWQREKNVRDAVCDKVREILAEGQRTRSRGNERKVETEFSQS